MALRQDNKSLLPALFDDATDPGRTIQIQTFINDFILRIAEECKWDNVNICWSIPSKDAGTQYSREFVLLRDGVTVSCGAVSARGNTVDQLKDAEAARLNKLVLIPRNRQTGYISVTTKTDTKEALKVEFAIVRRNEEGPPVIMPALVDQELSTVKLNYNEPLDGAEKAFQAFLDLCITEYQ